MFLIICHYTRYHHMSCWYDGIAVSPLQSPTYRLESDLKRIVVLNVGTCRVVSSKGMGLISRSWCIQGMGSSNAAQPDTICSRKRSHRGGLQHCSSSLQRVPSSQSASALTQPRFAPRQCTRILTLICHTMLDSCHLACTNICMML